MCRKRLYNLIATGSHFTWKSVILFKNKYTKRNLRKNVKEKLYGNSKYNSGFGKLFMTREYSLIFRCILSDYSRALIRATYQDLSVYTLHLQFFIFYPLRTFWRLRAEFSSSLSARNMVATLNFNIKWRLIFQKMFIINSSTVSFENKVHYIFKVGICV